MSRIAKKHESAVAPFFKNGVTLDFYTLTFVGADLTAKLDADVDNYDSGHERSPIVVALEAVQSRVSIEVISTARAGGGNTTLVLGIAALGGAYPSDNYDGTAGNESMAAYLQALIVAASPANFTYQGYDLGDVTVAANVRGTAW
jgi:hypothetical protein